ncbi:Carboxymethylenebutenolidase [Thalassocella blandensis]|nr:Carboxymethylenebutenolidase [Thalassocella blandensis]
MKIVISIITFVLVAIGAFIGIGLALPDQTHVERSIQLNASPEVVFAYTADHKEFQKWSPWSKFDPDMTVTFSGPEQGIGSTMEWKGNEKVGVGRSTFTEYVPNEKATVALDFGEMGGGTATYILQDAGDGYTKLTWTFDTQNKTILEKYIGLVIDRMLGPEYEKGLADLKEIVEAAPSYKSREIQYTLDGTDFTGYLAYPMGLSDPAPGIIVVHEWWGHNDYARKRADMLAEMGYVAFALDMYGDGKVTTHPQDANAFMMEVGANTELAEKRFDKALEVLMQNSNTNPTKIGAIGYCFGGSIVINMARAGKPLAGVVSFHGGLGNLMPIAENASAKMLVLNGAADPFVPQEQLDAFTESMQKADYPFELINYKDAKHAFTNPGATEIGQTYDIPLEYNADADRKSWEKMKDFLDEVFY